MTEWLTDELRPKQSEVLSVEPSRIELEAPAYVSEGDLLMFERQGCQGFVVAEPVEFGGRVFIDVATRYVRKVTQWSEWVAYDEPKVVYYDEYDGEPVYEYGFTVWHDYPFPHYKVLNVTPGTGVTNIGPVFREGGS